MIDEDMNGEKMIDEGPGHLNLNLIVYLNLNLNRKMKLNRILSLSLQGVEYKTGGCTPLFHTRLV